MVILRRCCRSGVLAVGLMLVATGTALAHDAPEGGGAEWIMADWMLLAFLVFFGVALAVFLAAWKRGHFHDLERPKYYLLTIDEPDYYTPEWVKEDDRAS